MASHTIGRDELAIHNSKEVKRGVGIESDSHKRNRHGSPRFKSMRKTKKDFEHLIGASFGALLVLEIQEFIDKPYCRALCQCACGGIRIYKTISHIVSGHTKSCGCLRIELVAKAASTHGLSNKPGAYMSWKAMNARCNYTKHRWYSNYGGRGIKVCERWSGPEGFKNFLVDMGERPEGFSLDRMDVNGPYSPDNCKWSSRSEQNKNRRPRKKSEPWL